jgi:hypothetical protein
MPLGYELFAGNRADVTTVEEVVESMEARFGLAQRICVMDRGMTSAENRIRARRQRSRAGELGSMSDERSSTVHRQDTTNPRGGPQTKCRRRQPVLDTSTADGRASRFSVSANPCSFHLERRGLSTVGQAFGRAPRSWLTHVIPSNRGKGRASHFAGPLTDRKEVQTLLSKLP